VGKLEGRVQYVNPRGTWSLSETKPNWSNTLVKLRLSRKADMACMLILCAIDPKALNLSVCCSGGLTNPG